jgi:general secretion pathway protein F/type IV pilus assembly protein PilC
MILFSGLILGVLLVIYALRKKEGRLFLQKLSLKIPMLKTLILQAALVRFCRSFSILLAGGVPLLDSLRLSRKVMNNLLLEQVIENAEKKIVEGKPLSAELKTSPLIPALVIRMLAISEETGNVAPMLQNIADIYEEELEKNLLQLTTLLQPILLMTLGLIVGVVLLSILIPLTDVGSIVGD